MSQNTRFTKTGGGSFNSTSMYAGRTGRRARLCAEMLSDKLSKGGK